MNNLYCKACAHSAAGTECMLEYSFTLEAHSKKCFKACPQDENEGEFWCSVKCTYCDVTDPSAEYCSECQE